VEVRALRHNLRCGLGASVCDVNKGGLSPVPHQMAKVVRRKNVDGITRIRAQNCRRGSLVHHPRLRSGPRHGVLPPPRPRCLSLFLAMESVPVVPGTQEL
jgi:hypothetical protein